MTVDDSTLKAQLAKTLGATHLDALGLRYEGKVRDNYSKDGRRFIIVTDRISAFDRVLGTIPFKGQVLNRLAAWWFEKTKSVARKSARPAKNVKRNAGRRRRNVAGKTESALSARKKKIRRRGVSGKRRKRPNAQLA